VATADSDEPKTAIVKRTGQSATDAGFVDRETVTYSEVLPLFSIRVPHLLGMLQDGGFCYLGLEDLSGEYRFPSREHHWSAEELQCFLPEYARLHVEGRGLARRPWMLDYQSPSWSPETVVVQAEQLSGSGVWGDLSGLEDLANWALDQLPALSGMDTVLHMDIHPPNVGLGTRAPLRAALIDWDMTGWGAPEFDLAYLDLQPFGSARAVARDVALDWYWREHLRLAGAVPNEGERQRRQLVADAVFALTMIPVAYRSVVDPYPSGSQPGTYWEAMRPVLFRKLQSLLRR
jgi:hypothetical protein